MANVCSVERVFWRKTGAHYRGITVALVLTLVTGCYAVPQRTQTADLLDRLSVARGKLADFPPPPDACNIVGDVETRLYGEPGLTEVQPAWSELADAAHALQAVCGQDTLLQQPISGSLAVDAARQRWSEGKQREMGVACDHLRAAAIALSRDAPC
jgi:hypothetical protein